MKTLQARRYSWLPKSNKHLIWGTQCELKERVNVYIHKNVTDGGWQVDTLVWVVIVNVNIMPAFKSIPKNNSVNKGRTRMVAACRRIRQQIFHKIMLLVMLSPNLWKIKLYLPSLCLCIFEVCFLLLNVYDHMCLFWLLIRNAKFSETQAFIQTTTFEG